MWPNLLVASTERRAGSRMGVLLEASSHKVELCNSSSLRSHAAGGADLSLLAGSSHAAGLWGDAVSCRLAVM